MNRNAITVALYNLLVATGSFGTTGRRVQLSRQIGEFPALFLRRVADKYQTHTGQPPRVTMHYEVWIYTKTTNPDGVPTDDLDALLDAVDAALQPDNDLKQTNTLGGLVSHCRIEGDPLLDPGDLTGIALAVIPIQVLVP